MMRTPPTRPAAMLKASRWLTVLALLLGSTAHADPLIEELAQRERAFAAHARSAGVRSAFLAAIAPQAVLFRPGPVHGPSWQSAQGEAGFQLLWCPSLAAVSAAGDLGASIGPYSLRLPDKAEDAGQGRFFSIWERQPEGGWKLLVDIGSSEPREQCPDRIAALAPGEALPADAPAAQREQRWQALLAVDLARNGDAGAGDAEADRLILRDQPARIDVAAPLLQTGARLAHAGDLAATWGAIGDPAVAGYLRLWAWRAGRWQLQVERAR